MCLSLSVKGGVASVPLSTLFNSIFFALGPFLSFDFPSSLSLSLPPQHVPYTGSSSWLVVLIQSGETQTRNTHTTVLIHTVHYSQGKCISAGQGYVLRKHNTHSARMKKTERMQACCVSSDASGI